MLKKIALAALLFITPISAYAYSPSSPDCSKDATFLLKLQTQGFVPLIRTDDSVIEAHHDLLFNKKTNEVILISVVGDKQVCVDYISEAPKVKADIDLFKKFLEQSEELK